ncbi:MAG TPA: hypothetical protein DHW82_00380 [Spirochaetia bacterium]|nr:MAG: hypothetical protein A2Y41_07255 [Spirochaetes bacterium GWB1_36_13]HCL55455.1 hypothetical protein [Spirochaetia bacterium]
MNYIQSKNKKTIDIKEYLKRYQTEIDFFDFYDDSEATIALIKREKIEKNEKWLSEEDKKKLYEIDKKAIELYHENKNSNEDYKCFSIEFLESIVKIASKFAKKYEKSQKNLVLH